jgi:hypothetical protein
MRGPTLSALAYVVGSRLGCRRHQFRALSLPIKGLYLLNMYIVNREVGRQNNAYATEEADVENGRTQPVIPVVVPPLALRFLQLQL